MNIPRATDKAGFTLIELLVVIAIISLLASVVMASLHSAREKAAASSIISQVQEIEKALRFLAGDENIASWWIETSFCASNCDISLMVTDTNRLGKYLSAGPSLPVGTNVHYDNDGDTFVCGGDVYWGVNIGMRNVPYELAEIVNQAIDGDGDLLCGRVRWEPGTGGSLFYSIANDDGEY